MWIKEPRCFSVMSWEKLHMRQAPLPTNRWQTSLARSRPFGTQLSHWSVGIRSISWAGLLVPSLRTLAQCVFVHVLARRWKQICFCYWLQPLHHLLLWKCHQISNYRGSRTLAQCVCTCSCSRGSRVKFSVKICSPNGLSLEDKRYFVDLKLGLDAFVGKG